MATSSKEVQVNTKRLIEAISEERFEDADKFLEGDLDYDVKTRDDNVIHVATKAENLNIIKKLISKKANIQQRNSDGDTPMHIAVRRGRMDIMKYLYDNGADLNVENMIGKTPMYLAARAGRIDIVKYLKDNGADINVINRDGDTTMHIAVRRGRMDIVKYLYDNGADLNVENMIGKTPMHFAAREGRMDIVKYLKDNGADLNVINRGGETPTHLAARRGRMDIVKYLMDNGADLNVINKNGESPLHQAVISQPMDVIETLVDMGMNPNIQSKETGQTPLHTALMFGRIEAMEALLIKGAKPYIRDHKKQKPEDVGKTLQIRESIRMYEAFLSAKESGSIKAKGMTLTTDSVKEPQQIDRVNIRLEYMDIPQEFPSRFYCRCEKFENSTVKLPKNDEEQIFSDVFHVRISDVNRDCPVKINLPLYSAPSNIEEIMLRFIDYENTDRVVSSISKVNEVYYCLLETKLIPETTCVCVLYVRPKKEENIVTDAGMVIKSEMVENFSMDIPAGAFEEETTLSLKVFDSNGDATTTGETTGAHANATSQKDSLLSDIFQINVSGQQPKKGVKMQIPLSKDMRDITNGDDIVIVTGDETKLEDEENTLEISKSKPKIINGVIVFNVSHFSIYVAASKDKVFSTSDLRVLKKHISNARERKTPGVFFVMVKKVDQGLKYLIKIECCRASRSAVRRKRLVSIKYEQQDPDESVAIMMAQGAVFTITLSGNACLEVGSDIYRKLTFYRNRVSSQPFTILLAEGIMDEKDATADVIVYQQQDNRSRREVAKLKVQLHLTPAPNSLDSKKQQRHTFWTPYPVHAMSRRN